MHVLRHDNIVTLHAIILETGHYGVVMEYVLHESLHDFVSKNKVCCSISTSAVSVCVCVCVCVCVAACIVSAWRW